MKIVIPAIPPSLNRFLGRKNYQAYRAVKDEWKTMVFLYARQAGKPPMFKKAVVRITYFFPTLTRRDPDNYNGKVILDGLTAAGVIVDDSFDCIKLELAGGYDKGNPRTEIEVEGV